MLLGGLACVLLGVHITPVAEAEHEAALELLQKADSLKTANYSEFTAIMQSFDAHDAALSPAAWQYLRYLRGWRSVYAGEYEAAVPALKAITTEPGDIKLQFRASATLANVLVLATRYEDAFLQLNQLLMMLPNVSDRTAREQGLSVTAYLYNQVGEYDLGLRYAETLLGEGPSSGGLCRGKQLKLEALYKNGAIKTIEPPLQEGIDTCERSGELTYANLIRTYVVRLYLAQDRVDEAIKVLRDHYDQVVRSRYPRMISEYNALLARAYRQKGDSGLVRRYAANAIDTGVKNQYTEPLIDAYRLQYLLAKEQGDAAAALTFYEEYAAADKGYLDDVSARQLAYERVKHEALANRLQIETLNKKNQLLQLQRENNRLYIVLLIMVLCFIMLWAYKIRRSQLHFMKLSRRDGLTGISNRPHFIDLAEVVLQRSSRARQEVCVMLCDLDHFKQINDRFGHAAGDLVLKQTVAACQAHLRAVDVFGRFGGEEFGFVLPGCTLSEARQRAEQIRLAIAGTSTPCEGVEGPIPGVSASFGIANSGASGYELRHLLAQADAALYQAKRSGRNRVSVAETALATAMAAAS